MESCCETDSQQSSLFIEEENIKQLTDASSLTSADDVQQLDAELLMEKLRNDDAEFTSAENVECARWSSLDSVVSAFDEELSSYNLPASDAALNVTFSVEVDSLSSYVLTDCLLDPKHALKIVYDVDESAGIDKLIGNCEGNKTYLIETPKEDCRSVPGVQHSAVSAGKTLSPAVCKPSSLYTEGSSDDETECHERQISDNIDAKLKGKVSGHKSDPLSDFRMANGEPDSSPISFELKDKAGVSARTMYTTSTPVSSPAEGCSNNCLDTQQTLKHTSSSTGRECPEYIPSARRMLRMCEVNNTTEERLIRKVADHKFSQPDDNILNRSFAMSFSEQDDLDRIFKVAGCQCDRTYTVSKLMNSAEGDCGTNPLHHKRLTSVRQSDHKARGRRSVSSVDNSYRCSKPRQSAAEQNSVLMNDDDLSVSNIDVFKYDGDIASFFVTEWPSALINEYHAQLLSTSCRRSGSLPEDVSSSQDVRIVIKSASSPSDLLADWSFSSLLGQVYPSFNDSSVNELGEVASDQQSSMCRCSGVTKLSGLDEKTHRLNDVGR